MNPPFKPTADNLPRVVRGGSRYNLTAIYVRAASRFDYTPTDRYYHFGFRCVLRGRQTVGKGST